MSALRELMTGLIDYAGLFPPAALEMDAAVHNYEAYLRGPDAWALGRFVVPAARLEDLAGRPFRLTVLGPPNLLANARGSETPVRGRQEAVIDAVELKAERPDDVLRAMGAVPKGPATYIEIPIAQDPEPLVAALAQTGARAKVRTGGLTAEGFPRSQELARFLHACAARKVAFKATAGLHHPLRSAHRFTYAADSPSGVMHGFVNVFLAACLVYFGAESNDAWETLEERSANAFRFEDSNVSWHGHHLAAHQIRTARTEFAMSFGSCSFEEPMAEVKELGWL